MQEPVNAGACEFSSLRLASVGLKEGGVLHFSVLFQFSLASVRPILVLACCETESPMILDFSVSRSPMIMDFSTITSESTNGHVSSDHCVKAITASTPGWWEVCPVSTSCPTAIS
jgi:hypothetical protein